LGRLVDSIPLSQLMKTSEFESYNVPVNLMRDLDLQREALQDEQISIDRITQTTVTVGTGVSVGYIIWLLRSGVVLGSMLSALPAWKSIDPLPILESLGGDDDGDDESLQSMVKNTPEADSNSSTKSARGKLMKMIRG